MCPRYEGKPTEIGRRLGRPCYQPPDTGDAIAHWIEYDSWQPPSKPADTYPQTRSHDTTRPAAVSQQTLQRQERLITRWDATTGDVRIKDTGALASTTNLQAARPSWRGPGRGRIKPTCGS
jgi:hypothetical protein